jgi:hypothetical protein
MSIAMVIPSLTVVIQVYFDGMSPNATVCTKKSPLFVGPAAASLSLNTVIVLACL